MAWNQECSECRSCAASSWHRKKCADRMNEQFEIDMQNEMERRYLLELQFEEHMEDVEKLK